MKSSKYTTVIRNGGEYIIYNTLHDKLLICNQDIIDLLNKHSDFDSLKDIHPSLFKKLCDDKFIIPDDKDEVKELIDSIVQQDDSDKSYRITINPTMDCNLRCWYCYEKHLANTNMSSEILDRIKNLLLRICSNHKTKYLTLSFFGGEPLLGFQNCVKPLIEYSIEICRKHDINLSLGFTTNAVLLDSKIVDFLSNTKLDVSMQIPFDGDRATHNSIKKMRNGEGTYDIVLKNLNYAVSKGISIVVRCNYTSKSASSFEKFTDDIMPLLQQNKTKIRVSFHRVWQDIEDKRTGAIIDQLEEKVRSIGGNCYNHTLISGRCYADKQNSFVINYNGDIYQCTAREFSPENKEGYLCKDGTIEHNERYYKRMESRFSNPECMECVMYPICAICTQKRLELNNSKCLLLMPEIDKFDKIRTRIKAIYELKTEYNKLHPTSKSV